MASHTKRVALVVGGTGMAANGIVPHLLNDKSDEYETVICLSLQVDEKTFASRTSKPYVPLTCNLNDKAAIAEALRKIGSPNITHIFWYAEANRPPKLHISAATSRILVATLDVCAPLLLGALSVSPQFVLDQFYGMTAYYAGSGRNELNQRWIANVLDACAESGARIESFMLGTGGKHYGMHLGPSLWSGYLTPYEEDKQKCPGPLTYFDSQDLVRERAKRDGFTWCEVRPTFIVGLAPELTPATQSFGLALAIYAIILKAKGGTLMYPGSNASYKAKINLVTSDKVAEIAVWSVDHLNNAYNAVSCPPFAWEEVWPAIAQWFGMEGTPPNSPIRGINTSDMMGKEAPMVWAFLQKQHNLKPYKLDCVLNNEFLDKSFTIGFDAVFSVDKLRRHGFPQDRLYEYQNATDLMVAFFDMLVKEKIIPNPKDVELGIYFPSS